MNGRRHAGKHLLSLINDILDLSKIEAGKMDLFLESFDIAKMVADVATTIQPLVAKNANALRVDCGDDLGAMRADLVKVRQALFNLLSNACKFTERGTVTLTVSQETADRIPWIIFRVRDSGIGMTPEQMEKLFQAFSQADVSTTRQFGGTGLGLANAQRLAEQCGGNLELAVSEGPGAAFALRLPVCAGIPAEDRERVGETALLVES